MRDFGVVIVIVVAGFVAWLAITNRLQHLGTAWGTLVGGGTITPSTPTIPGISIGRMLNA